MQIVAEVEVLLLQDGDENTVLARPKNNYVVEEQFDGYQHAVLPFSRVVKP